MLRFLKVFIAAVVVWMIVGIFGACSNTTSANTGWKDLGSPEGRTNVYRYCDGRVAIYLAQASSNGITISSILPAANVNGPCG